MSVCELKQEQQPMVLDTDQNKLYTYKELFCNKNRQQEGMQVASEEQE